MADPERRRKCTYTKKWKKGRFQPGNTFGSRHQGISRKEWEADCQENLLETGYNLRSSKKTEKAEHSMRIIHLRKSEDMWNTAFKDHRLGSPTCKKPTFSVKDVQRKGLVSKQSVRCINCKFETHPFKLYEEVNDQNKKGPKFAASNLALQSALLDTSIGQSKVQGLIAALDLPPPNKRQMTNAGKIVGEKIVALGEENMDKHLKAASDKNNEIKIAADTRYNTPRIGCSRRTGVSLANQAITLTIEKNTGTNKIVAEYTQNKLCPIGNRLRAKGLEVKCKGDHAGCVANVGLLDSLTESVAGVGIGRHLKSRGVKVTSCTTDGDSRFVKGLEEGLGYDVDRKADPIHLVQTQIRRAKKKTFSATFFPGVQTVGGKKACLNAFAEDLGLRASHIRKELQARYHGDTVAMSKIVPHVVETVIECYTGNCEKCKVYPSACGGGDSNDTWIAKSFKLQSKKIQSLNATPSDKTQMKELLEMVLSPQAIEKTSLMTTTQNNECANRSLSVNNPKHIKYSKNLRAKIASTIVRLNEGPGVAFVQKSDILKVPVSKGQVRFYKKQQKLSNYSKAYVKSERTITKRYRRDSRLRQQKAALTQPASDYQKDQLDLPEAAGTSTQGQASSSRQDHPYHVSLFSCSSLLVSIKCLTKRRMPGNRTHWVPSPVAAQQHKIVF